MQKLTFSGHESFACKQFWLKKAFDFTKSKISFNDELSVVKLGVGKNMVSSLRYWGKSFGVLQEDDSVSDVAEYLFGENGKDLFLEDTGSLWLLHYYLIKTNKASIYNLFFNEFRRERIEFTKDNLQAFLKRKCEDQTAYVFNSNTISTDIKVFLRNYVRPGRDEKVEIEDDFSCIFLDLNLITEYINYIDNKPVTYYKTEEQNRAKLPIEILLYSILDTYPGKTTISLYEVLTGINSPGAIFCLSMASLYEYIQQITSTYKEVTFSETAGNQILQIKQDLTLENVLNDYYQL